MSEPAYAHDALGLDAGRLAPTRCWLQASRAQAPYPDCRQARGQHSLEQKQSETSEEQQIDCACNSSEHRRRGLLWRLVSVTDPHLSIDSNLRARRLDSVPCLKSRQCAKRPLQLCKDGAYLCLPDSKLAPGSHRAIGCAFGATLPSAYDD